MSRDEVHAALHGPTDLADYFGGYLCRGGSSWLTTDCACDESTVREQLDALVALLESRGVTVTTPAHDPAEVPAEVPGTAGGGAR